MPPIPYGPNNPHPLSQLTTELVWEGNYDEYGHRREVDAAGASMPLQKIETITNLRAARWCKVVCLTQKRPTATTFAICSSGATTTGD